MAWKLMIRIAGNTGNPCLAVLRSKGYELRIDPSEDGDEEYSDWRAEKSGRCFSATNPEELLGLVVMWEHRGDDWRSKQSEPDISDELYSVAYPESDER